MMKRLKAILLNPYLLGAQGFAAGALLFIANPQPIGTAQAAPPPAAETQLVPPVS